MPLHRLALLTGLWPIVVVHVAYLISWQEGWVPACWPYWEGCTSISRAARHGSANLWFKLTMLPYALLLARYWLRVHAVLEPGATREAMRALGLIATGFLLLYVSFLGVEGETYQWLRRYGITGYFGGMVLALMLVTRLMPSPSRLLLAALLLGLGLASIPLQHWASDRDAAVNALEWSYALLMMLGLMLPLRADRRAAAG